jgi:hypothetical protein
MAGIEHSGKNIVTKESSFRNMTEISSEKLIKCDEIGYGSGMNESNGWFFSSIEVHEHKRSFK